MNATLLAALNTQERLLVAETERATLAALDEDEVVALHTRVRRARDKSVGQYRRVASAKVRPKGGRGKARPTNRQAALKAEAFEEALSRVSRRLGVLARQSATALRAERLEAAAAAKRGATPDVAKAAGGTTGHGKGRSTTTARSGDRALRSPTTEKNRASTRAAGDRRQAKRDSR